MDCGTAKRDARRRAPAVARRLLLQLHAQPRSSRPGVGTDLKREDVLWMQRITFGLDSSSIAELRRLGPRTLPRQAARARGRRAAARRWPRLIASSRSPAWTWCRRCAMSTRDTRPSTPWTDTRQGAGAQGAQRPRQSNSPMKPSGASCCAPSIRPAQLQEQMVWFWLNHFSVLSVQGQSALAGRRLRRARDSAACPRAFQRPGAWRRSNIRRCCSIWTTIRTPPAISTRTTRAS